MFIVILCIAGIAVCAPMFAALIVSVASRREEAHWSLGEPPSGLLDSAARRIVGFGAESIDWPRSKAHMRAGYSAQPPLPEASELVPELRPQNAP